jgi:3-hydroxyacyl-CoA dehydrogenase
MPVHSQFRDSVAILTIQNSPANTLTSQVLGELLEAHRRAVEDGSVKSILIMGEGGCFSAGANVHYLREVQLGLRAYETRYDCFNVLENSPKPIIAAISGYAVGGGLELAMAAHYRVSVPSARLGQPEVRLGLIPGAGGTQRLPRLVGVEAALKICVSGEYIDAAQAKNLGLVDCLCGDNLLADSIAFAARVAGTPHRRTRDRDELLKLQSASKVSSKLIWDSEPSSGSLAPWAAAIAVSAATKVSFHQGCALEAMLFQWCLASTESRTLVERFVSRSCKGGPDSTCTAVNDMRP